MWHKKQSISRKLKTLVIMAKEKESEDSRRGKILSKLFNLPDGILETMQVLANFSSGHLQ